MTSSGYVDGLNLGRDDPMDQACRLMAVVLNRSPR